MLALIGLSYRDGPLAQIASLSQAITLPETVRHLADGPNAAIRGAVTVSTCHRFEIYFESVRFHDAVDAIVDAVAAALGVPRADAAKSLVVRTGSDAATHLFRVAAGLESMVVGEAEISGQIGSAFRDARQHGETSSLLSLLFESAAHTAKRVSTKTALGAAGRSIAAAALDRAERRVGPLADSAVLLVGTGSYIRVVTAALHTRHCRQVSVFSSTGRQFEFAQGRGIRAVTSADLAAELDRADLVVTCSGTGNVVLNPTLVAQVLQRRQRPLHVVDLAARHDVPDATRQLRGVEVIDLNSMAARADEDSAVASATIAAADEIVAAAVDRFADKLAARQLDPAVVALRQHVTDLVEREMQTLRTRLPAVAVGEVQRSMHRISHSLLHTPTVRAGVLARDGLAAKYVDALHTLFGIDADLPHPPDTDV